MKFATLIAVTSAVRINQMAKGGPDTHTTAADIIGMCDQNGNGMLSKKEAHDCVNASVPPAHRDEANQMIDQMWPMVDADGNGEVDEHELQAAMEHGPPKLAKLMAKVQSDSEGSGSDEELAQSSDGSGSDHSGDEALAQSGSDGDGPSAADIIDECDKNGNGMLSKGEVHACIAKHVPPEHQDEANQMVDQMWDHVDKNGDGEIDEHELARAMRGGPPQGLAKLMSKVQSDSEGSGSESEGEALAQSSGSESEHSGDDLAQKLAQVRAKGGPSAQDIIDACDGNGSGGIDLDEAHACIDAHITDPGENAQAHQMVDAGFSHVDANGDGEIDKKELKAAMRNH